MIYLRKQGAGYVVLSRIFARDVDFFSRERIKFIHLHLCYSHALK